MIQKGCSQEDYNFFRREWLSYVRFYEKVDAYEIRDQLLNCLDTTLQILLYRALGNDVDTTTQAVLLMVIELLVLEKVEKAVYDDFSGENDNLSPTDVISQFKKHAVLVVNNERKQEGVPVFYGESGGQEGGTQGKIIPKTFASSVWSWRMRSPP
jgi:hypothetical protein